LDKPIPFDLVKRIVEFRVKENESKKKQSASEYVALSHGSWRYPAQHAYPQ
jgi:hypothetical protein